MLFLTRLTIAASAIAVLFPGANVPSEMPAAPRLGHFAHVERDLPLLAPEAWAPQDQADATYRKAREALSKNDYRQAAALFKEVVDKWPRSTYVSASLYWRAAALSRLDGATELRQALASLDEHDRRFPNASTIGDSRTLRTRINGMLARGGDEQAAGRVASQANQVPTAACPRDDDDNDMRIAALNALMQMDESRALPILQEVLKKREPCSEALRRKAVFLLSQHESAAAKALMLDIVRNDPSRSVREQAVHWLGQMEGADVLAALQDIVLRSTDMSLREKAVFALSQQESPQARAVLRQLVESTSVPDEVREKAIFWIGQDDAPDNAEFLRAQFGRLGRGAANEEMRKKIMFSLAQMSGQGNDRWLMSVAADSTQSVEIRKHAIFSAGQANVAAADLIALYDRVRDVEIREHLIWVLSDGKDRAATDKLIDIVRRDPDPRMRKKALFWLGQSNDPRVQALLLEIINKG